MDDDFLDWKTNGFVLGIEIIDNQHKELLGVMKRIIDICEEQNNNIDRELLQTLILMIEELFKRHFKDEEELMLEYDYPAYDSHKEHHNKMLYSVKQMIERMTEIKDKKTLEKLAFFLREWTMESIYGSDKLFGEYIKTKAKKKELTMV